MESGIIVSKENRVLRIVLDRPSKLNAITEPVLDELVDAIRKANVDPEVRVVVLTGTGRAFCSGMDVGVQADRLHSAAEAENRVLLDQKRIAGHGARVLSCFFSLSKPIIAQINGVAAGAGMALALACDIRVASDKAVFANAYLRRGLVPDLGLTRLLPSILGYSKACELTFLGERIHAEEAVRLGLVNRMVPEDALENVVREMADRLARQAPVALQLTKQLLSSQRERALAEATRLEAYAQSVCLQTQDYREGIEAFVNKRDPQFTGL